MTPEVRAVAAVMTGALGFYTAGVWSERLAARLRPWHLAMFWLGCGCDSAGTAAMARMAGGFRAGFHGLTGAAALALMLAHAVWATVVLLRRNERAIRSFHRISVVVWTVWLVPFVSGALLA
ncbi:MAG TPA: HsmA family protein [Gemmatimonadales bacterium]|nr:HsmA family protein [Gemmatimonadales bacterium]